MTVRQGDIVRLKSYRYKDGKVSRLFHNATKAHVKWDFGEGVPPSAKNPRRTVENVCDLEVIKSKRKGK